MLYAPHIGAPGAAPPSTGYWEVVSDGGLFAYRNAGFGGSLGGKDLNAAVRGIVAHDGNGYRLFASDGGAFAFGDAPFLGSAVQHCQPRGEPTNLSPGPVCQQASGAVNLPSSDVIVSIDYHDHRTCRSVVVRKSRV
jgi:hypothetical protein